MEKKISLPVEAGEVIGGGYSGTVYKVRDGSVPPRFGVLKAHFGAEVCAIGIPGIAIITSTSQSATYDGGDTNAVSQANPADVTVPVTLGK